MPLAELLPRRLPNDAVLHRPSREKDEIPQRRQRRTVTAPATPTSSLLSGIGWGDLRPPDTPEVRKQLAVEGPSTTLLDIALGVVRRLHELPDADPAELLFLRDCLKAGRAKTVVPCALLRRHDGNDEVGNFLLRTYTRSSSPGSVASVSSHSTGGLPSFHLDQGVPPTAGTVPRWPSSRLDTAVHQELEALMDNRFDLWAFDTFALSGLSRNRPLQFVGWEAMRRNNFFAEFAIDPEKAQCFLQRAESLYAREDKTPYHNNLHAADVTQSVHALLGEIGFGVYFSRLNTLSLVLGAIVHDMGHDGRNNAFHIKVQDELALTYNDQSVLENYHVSLAFKLLMNEPSANVLASLSKEQVVVVRKEMIETVLGTDMAHHFSKVSGFKDFSERLSTDPHDWRTDQTALMALQSMVLHAADICNPAKPAALSDRWTDLLKKEFFLQGDEEKRLDIPVSPLCDRDTVKFASSQVGFIQFIVRPTFALLAELVPKVEAVILQLIDVNMATWQERKEVEEEEASLATI